VGPKRSAGTGRPVPGALSKAAASDVWRGSGGAGGEGKKPTRKQHEKESGGAATSERDRRTVAGQAQADPAEPAGQSSHGRAAGAGQAARNRD